MGGDGLEGDFDALISPFPLLLPGPDVSGIALSEAFP